MSDEMNDEKQMEPSGWRPGMYEGKTEAQVEAEVGKGVQELKWDYKSSRPRPSNGKMGFKGRDVSWRRP